jgi:hypothetical protein
MAQFPIDETINKRKTLTRADFRPEEFRKLIIQKGLKVEWTQNSPCPCSQNSTQYGLNLQNITDVDASPGTNNQSCTVCGGSGLIYHSSQEIRAIMTQGKADNNIALSGLRREEDVKFTTMSEHLLSYGDKIKLKNSVIVQNETLTKTASNTVTLKYPIIRRTLELATGQKTIGVLYCHLANSTGVAIPGAERIEGIHFNVNNSGQIVWLGDANTPAVGTKYSISYYANPVYIIIDHPHTIRDTFNLFKTDGVETHEALPVQAYGRLAVL